MTRRSLFGIAYSVHNRSRNLIRRPKAGMEARTVARRREKTEYSNEAHTFLWGSALCSFFSGIVPPKADDGRYRSEEWASECVH